MVYLCEEISAELDSLTRENEFKAFGFIKRLHGLEEYKREQRARNGYPVPKSQNANDAEDFETKKLPPIDWNKPIISINSLL